MLSTIQYRIVQRDARTNAKVTELTNPVTHKQSVFTGAFFDVRSSETFKFMEGIFTQKDYKIENVRGVQIPFHDLPQYASRIHAFLPENCLMLSDLCTEVIYFSNVSDEKKKFYYTYNLFPEEVKQKMKSIHSAPAAEKLMLHKQAWQEITSNKKLLLNLISNFVREQMRFRLDFISVPSPLIIDTAHLDFVESCYQTALNLYNTELLDIEKEQGKILTLYLNIHKRFLAKEGNVRELLATVKRLKPKAIVYKISGLEDLREETDFQDGWLALVKGLGLISSEDGVPTVYAATSVEGLIATCYGTDCITQAFYKNDNIEGKFALPGPTMSRLWQESKGTLSAGKISIYESKEFVSRLEFETLLKHTPPPIPMPEIEPLTYDDVHNMTNASFRAIAKKVLLFQRNMEFREIIGAINASQMSLIKGKFRRWMRTLDLFP